MIQANELRIGNILNYRTSEGDILPAKLDWQDLKWISEDEKGFNTCHSPIILAEDILLNSGFEFAYEPENKEFVLDIGGLTFYLCDRGTDFEAYLDGQYIKTIKCLHELQNLYYALTGEELVIKFK